MKNKQIQGYIKTIESELQQFKSTHKDGRIIEGYFTTTDLDKGGEVSLPTAFTNTMTSYLKHPVITYMHDLKSVVGKVLEHRIDEKGVWIRAKLAKNVAKADEVWNLIEQDMIKGFSYGYKVIEDEEVERDGQTVNLLKEVDLYEISVVPVPMNSEAVFSFDEKGYMKGIDIKTKEDREEEDEKETLTEDQIKVLLDEQKEEIKKLFDEQSEKIREMVSLMSSALIDATMQEISEDEVKSIANIIIEKIKEEGILQIEEDEIDDDSDETEDDETNNTVNETVIASLDEMKEILAKALANLNKEEK